MCPLRDPHSRGGSQTSRWCRRPRGGGGGRWAERRLWRKGLRSGPGSRTTAWLGLSPTLTPGPRGDGGHRPGEMPAALGEKEGSCERGKEAEAAASLGSCPPLGAPPAGLPPPSGCRCTSGRAGPRSAGSLSLGVFPPRRCPLLGAAPQNLFVLQGPFSVHHCARGTKRPESPLTVRPWPALPFQKR